MSELKPEYRKSVAASVKGGKATKGSHTLLTVAGALIGVGLLAAGLVAPGRSASLLWEAVVASEALERSTFSILKMTPVVKDEYSQF